jgi:hypothetical protein
MKLKDKRLAFVDYFRYVGKITVTCVKYKPSRISVAGVLFDNKNEEAHPPHVKPVEYEIALFSWHHSYLQIVVYNTSLLASTVLFVVMLIVPPNDGTATRRCT